MTAAETYAARVDAVLAQRARLRGPQPPGDLFAGLPPDHPLLVSDPRRPLGANLEVMASYVEPDDVIVDVGGGAGRLSLPLALRCREVVNVDPSPAMGAGFAANVAGGGIANVRFINGDWPLPDAPTGDLVLVNHVTYLTRDIVPFLAGVAAAARRRVLITVNSPPPPTMHRRLYHLLHGEEEALVPGHAELAAVLWELGFLPDIRVLPEATVAPLPPAADREAAVQLALARFASEQWAFWPLEPGLAARARRVVEAEFDALFAETPAGFVPRWVASTGREILLTWETGSRAG
jgi:SAM-dependent methyltransferase